jgi:CHAD domain-containing protein
VATRRLRAALWVLKKQFSKKERKKWGKTLSRLSDVLSETRDLDVHIEFLKNFPGAALSKKQAQGLNELATIYKIRRRDAQTKALAEVKRFNKTKIPDQIGRAVAQDNGRDDHGLRALARKKVTRCLKNLLAYEPYVKKPHARKKLHRMRIEAKHLRYTLELFQAIYPGESEEYLRNLVEIQRALGSVHEFDVWLEQARALKNNRQLSGFLKYYHHECEKCRKTWYEKFVHLWKKHKHAKTWQKIYEMVS